MSAPYFRAAFEDEDFDRDGADFDVRSAREAAGAFAERFWTPAEGTEFAVRVLGHGINVVFDVQVEHHPVFLARERKVGGGA